MRLRRYMFNLAAVTHWMLLDTLVSPLPFAIVLVWWRINHRAINTGKAYRKKLKVEKQFGVPRNREKLETLLLGKRHPRTRIEIATDLLPVGKRGPSTPQRQRKPLGAELAGGKPKGGLKGCLRDVDCQFIYPAGVRFPFGALSFELFSFTTLHLWTRWWSMALYILSLKQLRIY